MPGGIRFPVSAEGRVPGGPCICDGPGGTSGCALGPVGTFIERRSGKASDALIGMAPGGTLIGLVSVSSSVIPSTVVLIRLNGDFDVFANLVMTLLSIPFALFFTFTFSTSTLNKTQ